MEKTGELSELWPTQNEILTTGSLDEEKSAGKLDLEQIQMDTDLSKLHHEVQKWFMFLQMDGLEVDSEKFLLWKNKKADFLSKKLLNSYLRAFLFTNFYNFYRTAPQYNNSNLKYIQLYLSIKLIVHPSISL